MHLLEMSLKRNQKVWAIVEEVQGSNQVLVNFAGDLLRVTNMTQKSFRTGERVQLLIVDINPLTFKLLAPATTAARNRSLNIDVTV